MAHCYGHQAALAYRRNALPPSLKHTFTKRSTRLSTLLIAHRSHNTRRYLGLRERAPPLHRWAGILPHVRSAQDQCMRSPAGLP